MGKGTELTGGEYQFCVGLHGIHIDLIAMPNACQCKKHPAMGFNSGWGFSYLSSNIVLFRCPDRFSRLVGWMPPFVL